ncbi:MAG TPA: XRE family transcriptional regulator [Rhizomicrobium sp.]|nr:XRE family transcriptional regulator [Rhizomicrobium sp.]
MSTIVNDIGSRLADTLKRLRDNRGWTLADLATRSGVSRAMIHKVESGASSPTATLLGRLSGAFGLTVSQLLLEAEGRGSRVARARDNPVWTDPETGFRRRVLSPPALAGHLELIEGELPPGAAISYPASAYQFLEHQILVLAGELTFVEGSTTHRLKLRDCLALGAAADCEYRNEGRTPCRYLIALTRRAA